MTTNFLNLLIWKGQTSLQCVTLKLGDSSQTSSTKGQRKMCIWDVGMNCHFNNGRRMEVHWEYAGTACRDYVYMEHKSQILISLKA